MSRSGTAFAACALGAGWVLAGYPAALAARPRRPWREDAETPPLTVVVPGFNEREALARKLGALGGTDYPADRLRVLVPVDGDEETARMAAAALPAAEVLFEPERGGKAAGVNRALAHADTEWVVITDANNVLAPGSLRAAARHFGDPGIWAVAGRRGERGSAYDRYEDLIRRLETRSGSVAAASGEFLAFRRSRIPALPEGVVNDDLWILCTVVAGGGRAVYEPEASSTEDDLAVPDEVARRSRIGAGRLMLWRQLGSVPPGFALRLVSHKFGRLALPFLLLGALLAALTGARRDRRLRALAALQAAGYATGALTAAGHLPRTAPTRALAQFTVGNAAVAAGVVRAARGRQSAVWEAVR
jgi:cellulose synthase/poly-beta-1,6-N-acetylglucosamine synthase-like glycosyltransferase